MNEEEKMGKGCKKLKQGTKRKRKKEKIKTETLNEK